MKRTNILLLALALTACNQIDTGNVGVESTMGQYKEQTLPPGVYQTISKTVHEVTAKEVPLEVENIRPKTADNVTLQDVDLTVYYKINPTAAAKIMIKYSGDMVHLNGDTGQPYVLGASLIQRTVRESVYKAVARLQSSDAHTKRTEIAAETLDSLQKEINTNAGKDMFTITNVIVKNLVTDPGLEESIKQAAQVQFQIRAKNQQIDLAKSEAERKRIEANGEAAANAIISASLTDRLVQLRAIESQSKFATTGTHTVLMQSGAQALVQVK